MQTARIIKAVIFITTAIILSARSIEAVEISGNLGGEARAFTSNPLYQGQEMRQGSFYLQPEFYHEWESGNSITFVPFYRLDSVDSERTHFDIRELTGILLGKEGWELRVGIRKLFWGVTESVHLVDIINQTDIVESPDGEEKLGQPMANLSIETENGALDLFIMPYFRERTFPGRKGRLRSEPLVDTSLAEYESSRGKRHIDYALRYTRSFDIWEVGLSHFRGTGRDPVMVPKLKNNQVVLAPRYELIRQTGADIQLIMNDWLWKLEAISRLGQSNDSYYAFAYGVEYTFVGLFSSNLDMGLLGEWIYDSRGGTATPMDNDLLTAFRFTLNDAAGTEAILGIISDIKTASRFVFFESSRRVGESFRISLEANAFIGIAPTDLFFSRRTDDFVQLGLQYYY